MNSYGWLVIVCALNCVSNYVTHLPESNKYSERPECYIIERPIIIILLIIPVYLYW